MIAWWQRVQEKLAPVFGADKDAVRQVEAFERRHRELGHCLGNLQMRIEPLQKMVEGMRESE